MVDAGTRRDAEQRPWIVWPLTLLSLYSGDVAMSTPSPSNVVGTTLVVCGTLYFSWAVLRS